MVEGECTGLSSSPTPHGCDLLWLRRFEGWLWNKRLQPFISAHQGQDFRWQSCQLARNSVCSYQLGWTKYREKTPRTTSQSKTPTFRMHASGRQINFPLRNLSGNTKKTSLPSCTWSWPRGAPPPLRPPAVQLQSCSSCPSNQPRWLRQHQHFSGTEVKSCSGNHKPTSQAC